MYAADILNLTFFPKGTILTFSTEAWNNATNPGFKDIWKICDGRNGTPNLVNIFLRGSSSSGATGGANSDSVTLTANNLPSHIHGATGLSLSGLSTSGLVINTSGGHGHSGSGSTNSGSGGHTHNVSGSTSNTSKTLTGTFAGGEGDHASMSVSGIVSGSTDTGYMGFSSARDFNNYRYVIDATHTHNISGSTPENGGTHSHDVNVSIPESGSHSHTISGSISGGAIGGSTANVGSSQAFSVDTVPAYYTVIYIIKVV
jgi:hypothetical protein